MAAALPHRRRLRAVRAALCAGSDEPRPPGWPELRKSATPSRDHPLPPLGLSAEIEFHERGFIVVRKLIPEQMCERMMQGYQRAIEGGRDRKPNDPEGEPLLMQVGGRGRDGTGQPEWEGIPYLERIVAVGKQLMGDDMDFAYDQIIYKPPGTSVELLWHQDAGYGWPGQANARGMTSWLALSPATEAMGSLHFVPGSHKGGIVEHFDCSDWNPVGGALQAAVPEEAGVLVEYEIGDVSFHHGRCLHYSRGNSTSTPRCGLSTHLWPSPNEISDPKAAEELEALLTERVATRRKWSERHL